MISVFLVIEQIQIHIFMVIYSLMDSYILWKSLGLRGNAHNEPEMFETWGNWNFDNVSTTLVELSKPENKESIQPVYQESVIGERELSFMGELIKATSEIDCMESPNPFIVEEDYITMRDWEVEPEPISIAEEQSQASSARIVDNVLGLQAWVVEVVGEEQGYLHVSDGTARTWVDASQYGQFYRRDILSLIVEKTGDDHRVVVHEIDVLQRRSTDFLIPDETWIEEQQEIVISA